MEMIAGVLLQYLRSLKNFPEWASLLVVFGVSALAFWLSPAGAGVHDPRAFVQGIIPHALTMLGITQATSSAANVVAGAKPTWSPNPLLPVTDSM